jgi:hypothetical protein
MKHRKATEQHTLEELLIEMGQKYIEDFYEEKYNPEDEFHIDVLQAFVNGGFQVAKYPAMFGFSKAIVN